MIKKFLIASALVIASPALAFSQDLFVSWRANSNASSDTQTEGVSGVATIFADEPFAFDALDLDITSSDPTVLLLTGGTGFNGEYVGNPFLSGVSFNSNNVTIDQGVANLFAANITENGIIPAGASFSDEYVLGASSSGAAGAVRLGEVTYDLLAGGDAALTLSLGSQGALALPMTLLDPSLGTASLTVVPIPEPSSASLLVLGALGMVARRRKARA